MSSPRCGGMSDVRLFVVTASLFLAIPAGGGLTYPSSKYTSLEHAIAAAQLGVEDLTLRPGAFTLADGQHTILGEKLVLRGDQQGSGGSRGGEGETSITGAWHLLDGSGRIANAKLMNGIWPMRPYDPVSVLNITGGVWFFDECEVAGEGTGLTAQALVNIEGANATFRSCVVQPLQLEDGANETLAVHNVFYIGDQAGVVIQDSEVMGGDFYCMYLFGCDTEVTITDSFLHKSNCMFALDEMSVLNLTRCTVRDVETVFHIWSPFATVNLVRNNITGQLFEDGDHLNAATSHCKHNNFDPPTDPTEPLTWACDCGQEHSISTFQDHEYAVLAKGGKEAEEMKEYFKNLYKETSDTRS